LKKKNPFESPAKKKEGITANLSKNREADPLEMYKNLSPGFRMNNKLDEILEFNLEEFSSMSEGSGKSNKKFINFYSDLNNGRNGIEYLEEAERDMNDDDDNKNNRV